MIPEIGQLALILALGLALAQASLPIIGAAKRRLAWMAIASPAAQGQFAFVAIALACLGWSFYSNDFSVANVATNSNSKLPLAYRLSATWGSHEGSLLLWTFMLGFWTTAVTVFGRRLPREMQARVLGVLGLVSCGFLLFMLLTSNPFDRLFPVPADGRDLNPLLQDPGMVMHPPMLYMGYVGFSVAFAFAIAALMEGRLDAAWARWTRPWTTLAWTFLTLGVALGSFWAYYELGWGGWWFWDPVENASFMPWLVGTALMHSLAVTEKRGAFKGWTVLLAILAFSLSLLGTFLVRSGVLTSVHAFATDPRRGVFVLAFLGVVVGGSLALFAARAPRLGLGGTFDWVSRETMLLVNNVLLLVAAGAVLLGTLYPLVLDSLGLGKISVGPPYFETVFAPVMALAILLLGIGPIARWKSNRVPELVARLRWAALASVAAAALLPLALGRWSPLIATGLLLTCWIVATCAVELRGWMRHEVAGASVWSRLRRLPRAHAGMLVAHFGVAVFIAGVTVVKGYEIDTDVKLDVGESTEVGGYRFRLAGVENLRGPNYVAARGTIEVTREGKKYTVLYPEKRTYTVQNMPMTESAIDYGFFRHLYVALGEELGNNVWLVRVHYKPLIAWIWYGCLLMALGGALAASDRRYRIKALQAAMIPRGRTVSA
ncbi:MAG: c-type cytochrome biogenesis protein CcmF [Betaproteobacteria bacterium RIFCSPLOWO2_02_FULL_63_19]|nr:MAG: c-type cytochrome biogenesis protein CcmF [Betaproteobacteria bacterium RIFCSPLOWO2_02_FULL_63_19]